MNRATVLLLAATLSACASAPPPPDPQASFQRASTAAFREMPRHEPVALPALSPESRLQSQLEQLSVAETAAWILPQDEATRVVRRDILTGHMPTPTAIVLYRTPQDAASPGLCSVSGDDIWLRVPNENGLTYDQHLNPPLQPFMRQPFTRWRVAGSTIGATRPDCARLTPGREWFEAPSEGSLFRAVNIVERAQTGAVRPAISCRQLAYDEARQDFATPACANAKAMLVKLTPALIRRVRPGDCEIAPSPTGCLAIEYDDPAAPGTNSLYVVTMPDEDRPAWLQITQAMLPPS